MLRPLNLIFKKCLTEGVFPKAWKFANVQPIHKKYSRQIKSNYRPISLLPVCGKILLKIVFDVLYSFININSLISKDQPGFRPSDSTINQIISITSSIFESFENFDETRALVLDISKLKRIGVSGPLLALLNNYLKERQRVVLNGCQSYWKTIEAGVLQGSVLDPLLFLVYINDLSENILANMKLFGDDSSLFCRVSELNETHCLLEKDLPTIQTWAQ